MSKQYKAQVNKDTGYVCFKLNDDGRFEICDPEQADRRITLYKALRDVQAQIRNLLYVIVLTWPYFMMRARVDSTDVLPCTVRISRTKAKWS